LSKNNPKSKPDPLRFTFFDLDEIPKEWDIVFLRDIVKSYKNGIYKKEEFYGSGFPSVRMYNIKDGTVNIIGAPLLDVTQKEFDDYSLLPNDILINRVNSVDIVGKAGIVPDDLGPATFESKNIRIRLNLRLCNPRYINYYLSSEYYLRQIRSFTKAAVCQATINQGDLNRVIIPLPSIEEQKHITEILDNCQHLRTESQKSLHESQRLKKGLMKRLLSKGIGHTGFKKTKIGEIPENWKLMTCGDLYYIKGRIGWRGLKKSDFTDQGPYLITGVHFSDGRIDWDSCFHIPKEKYHESPEIMIQSDDVLITKDGTIGKVAIIKQVPEEGASLNSHLLLVRNLSDNSILPLYTYHILQSHHFIEYVRLNQVGGTRVGLTQKAFENFTIPVPPLEEQRKIVSILQICENTFKTKIEYIHQQDTLKKGLMQVLLNGKVRVKA
jgi:type I restriction enzyme S subunit